MKKSYIIIISITIICLIGFGFLVLPTNNVTTEYLRIHIRANSNCNADQQVKYEVKNKVVEYLTPFIAECDTKEKAQIMLNNNLENIEKVANKVLNKNGFNYTSKASVREENFPTRVYNDLTLESGFYDALIIELGSGTGDNWWCVVYPPLCFVGNGTQYIYKSKIMEIIQNFRK